MPSATFPVREVLHATPRTRLIGISVGSQGFAFNAGQAVMVGLSGSPMSKPYSIASAPWEVARTGMMQLLIQIDDSALDPHLERATPGTQIDVEGPFGTFGLQAGDPPEPLLLVAGGTGIAPLRSILMACLASAATPPIAVIYSARSAGEFAFLSELKALHSEGRITAHFTVTRTDPGAWPGRGGRIDRVLLETALPSAAARCLICGPPQLVSDTKRLLEGIGVPGERILTERY